MLVRRFTIVCLLIAIFGFALAIIVAETSRPAKSWSIGTFIPCVFEHGIVCAPPRR